MSKTLSISCDKNNLIQIRAFVKHALSAYKLSEVVLNQMVLAVDEICANLIIHANEEDSSQFLHLRIISKQDQLLFEITDNGKSFKPADYKEPDILEHIRKGQKGGVGIALVKRIMDRVEFTSNGSKNVCRLYKELSVPKSE